MTIPAANTSCANRGVVVGTSGAVARMAFPVRGRCAEVTTGAAGLRLALQPGGVGSVEAARDAYAGQNDQPKGLGRISPSREQNDR